MTSRDFCYWLQGFLEVRTAGAPDVPQGMTHAQIECVQKHLNLVFKHEIDPSAGDAKHQASLNQIHNPDAIGSGVKYRC